MKESHKHHMKKAHEHMKSAEKHHKLAEKAMKSHSDVKEDKALIRKEVKKSALKAKGAY